MSRLLYLLVSLAQFLRQVLIGKYKEAQGNIKGLQGQVEELQTQQQGMPSPAASDGVTATDGDTDSAFGATIAALQSQLREVTKEKEDAEERATAAAAAVTTSTGARDDDNGHDKEGGAAAQEEGEEAATALRWRLEEMEKTHEGALAEKQAQNEDLVKKVRKLLATCRSLQEQQQQQQAEKAGDGEKSATAVEEEATQELRTQLEQKQEDNDKLMSRLRELAQRYQSLQQSSSEASSAATTATTNDDAAGRLEDTEKKLEAANTMAAELTQRCQEAEAAHERVEGSLAEALERLKDLESGAAVATAAAAAGNDSQEKLHAENASLEKRVGELTGGLEASRQGGKEVSEQLEAKSADLEKMVRASPSAFLPCLS